MCDTSLTASADDFELICMPCRKDGFQEEAIMYCDECQEYYCASCTKCHRNMKATKAHQLINVTNKTQNSPKPPDTVSHQSHYSDMYLGKYRMLLRNFFTPTDKRSEQIVKWQKPFASGAGGYKSGAERLEFTSDGYLTEQKAEHSALRMPADRNLGPSPEKTNVFTQKSSVSYRFIDGSTALINETPGVEQDVKVAVMCAICATKIFCYPEEITCMACNTNGHYYCDNCLGSMYKTIKTPRNTQFEPIRSLKKCDKREGQLVESLVLGVEIESNYDIFGICVLPNSEILFASYSLILKTDCYFRTICKKWDCGEGPIDVCYIGNDSAAVSCRDCIELVDVKDLSVKDYVELENDCNGLSCSNDVLYINDNEAVYSMDINNGYYKLFFADKNERFCIYKTAVSDDGERIYIVNGYGSIVTVDRGGNRLATLRSDLLQQPRYATVADDGTVFVCDYHLNTVVQVNSSGTEILRTVVRESEGLNGPMCIYFDRKNERIIVGTSENTEITLLVYTEKRGRKCSLAF